MSWSILFAERIRMNNVLIIDSQGAVGRGISMLLDEEKELNVCGAISDHSKVMAEVERVSPELIVLDIDFPGKSGLDILIQIRKYSPKTIVLVFSNLPELTYAQHVIQSGAKGYLLKNASASELVRAIHSVLSGEIYMSEAVDRAMRNALASGQEFLSRYSSLSDRELQVFRAMGQKKSTRDIALEFHLSIKTIEAHHRKIKRKLGIARLTDVIISARQAVASGQV